MVEVREVMSPLPKSQGGRCTRLKSNPDCRDDVSQMPDHFPLST